MYPIIHGDCQRSVPMLVLEALSASNICPGYTRIESDISTGKFEKELMKANEHPFPNLPEPLRGSDPGSFAERTVKIRMPDIARRTLSENDFPPEIVAKLQALIDEIPFGSIRSIQDPGAPDLADWEAYSTPYLGRNWLEIPWFFGEHYFYRRIVEATGNFQNGPWGGRDPYAYQKRAGLENSQGETQALVDNLERALHAGWERRSFLRLLNAALWGNQADLSLWPAGEGDSPAHSEEVQREHLLVDDALTITDLFGEMRAHGGRVDFLVDNAGFELVSDLCLADYLLSTTPSFTVRLDLKPHPTFVSDAMSEDVRGTVAFLGESNDQAVSRFSSRLKAHLQSGRLQLREDFFWTSPLESWKMPPHLRGELERAALVISKGDAQYRRLLGDRHWPFTTPIDTILSYFPSRLVILRALKSEVLAGIEGGLADRLFEEDEEWLYNGRWGLIQLFQPSA
jgi:hypothetical protein